MTRLIEDIDGTNYKFSLNVSRKIIRVYKLNNDTKKYVKFKISKRMTKLDIYNFTWFTDEGMINWLRLDYYGTFKIWR